jgi:RES domain-containing protein
MLVYRIVKTKRAHDLSGEGARMYGGRWNSVGTPAIYTACSVSLATLEILVHTTLNFIPGNLVLVSIELPDSLSVKTIKNSELAKNWFRYPAPLSCAKIGDRWIRTGETVALRVPSAIIPDSDEYNYLLNPLHPEFKQVSVHRIKPYSFDRRFYDSH